MAAQTTLEGVQTRGKASLSRQQWVKIGLSAALPAILLVLAVQAIALALWPEIAAFRPLNSYPRSALFTLIPALAATALFARLARTAENPVGRFIKIALVVLLVSFIPDYLLPFPDKTFLASSVAALMHIVAGLAITIGITAGYRRTIRKN
jgi:hypothetical protein